jgi:drug/metabolite transporter (DMT)-like permease
VLTALLGAATAALFGSSDFLGGVASRKSPALIVTAVTYLVGVVCFSVVVLIARPTAFTSSDLVWALASGVAGTTGVLSLYAALGAGRMGIVAPITAALAGAGPAAFDLLRGSHVSVAALVGIVLALAAVVVVSTVSDPEAEHATPPRAIALAVLSGTGFAVSLVALSLTHPQSGMAPLLVARVTGLVVLALALGVRRMAPRIEGQARYAAVLAGVLDASANVTMLTAIRIGPLAVASVVGSLYPVVTILLARVVLKERLHRSQVYGVAMALGAVVLTAVK